MPTNEPMRFCSADSVHKFLLIKIHGDMIGGGGAECTRERREEGAAADIKFYGYEPRTSSVICECYSRELRGCASFFFHTLSLSCCGVLAPPMTLPFSVDAQA